MSRREAHTAWIHPPIVKGDDPFTRARLDRKTATCIKGVLSRGDALEDIAVWFELGRRSRSGDKRRDESGDRAATAAALNCVTSMDLLLETEHTFAPKL